MQFRFISLRQWQNVWLLHLTVVWDIQQEIPKSKFIGNDDRTDPSDNFKKGLFYLESVLGTHIWRVN
jgi:hypothetical protein